MTVSAGKVTGGLLLLVGVWIAIYWWWEPSEPKVSFSKTPAAAAGATLPKPQASVPPLPGPAPAIATVTQAIKPTTPAPAPAPVPRAAQPAEKPPTPAVKPPEFWEYTVSGGETLQTISNHFYKTPDYATAIARANPLMDPTRLKAGKIV